jgi:hypothetical protein
MRLVPNWLYAWGMRQYEKSLLYGEAWIIRQMFIWGLVLLAVVVVVYSLIANFFMAL